MSEPLPPVDQARNRELIAERLGWPADGLPACISLEADFPRWTVFWTKGGLERHPRCGYRAFVQVHNERVDLFAETPEELRAQLAEADQDLPSWPPRWT